MNLANIFWPGRALVERFRFGSKFVIVGVVLLLPFAGLFYANWQRIKHDIAVVDQERSGLQLLVPALGFMQAVQLHREHSRDLLAGQSQAAAEQAAARQRADEVFNEWTSAEVRHGEALGSARMYAEIRNQWAQIKTFSAPSALAASMAAHGDLMDALSAYLLQVGDAASLSMDAEVTTYFLQDAAIKRIPATTEAVRQLRAAAIKAARQRQMSPEERLAMNLWLGQAQMAGVELQRDLNKVLRDTPALQASLGTTVNQLRERQALFLRAVQQELLDARRIQQDPAAIAAMANENVAVLQQLLDQTLPVLDEMLLARSQKLAADLQRDTLISLASLLLALYLFAALRSSVIAQLAGMKASVAAISRGDFDRPVNALGRDEIGELAVALDKVRTDLGQRLETERKLSEQMLRVKMALDNAGTPFRIADQSGTVVYANPQMLEVLRSIEPAMKQINPAFSIENFVGSSIGNLMSDPVEYLARLEALKSLSVTEKEVGGRVFSITTAPVFDEQGRRLGTVGEWIDRTDQVAMERELAEIVNAAAAGDFSKRLSLTGKTGFFLNLGQSMNQLLETGDHGLHAVASILQALSRGDLTQHMQGNYQGLFAQLQGDANTTVERLRELVQQIREASELINSAAREIAAGNADLSSRTEEQASSLEETASSMEELSATVRQNADSARQANALADDSNVLAVRGGEMVQRVVGTMTEIQEGSRRIADIVGVIDAIAFQTNILALNAAVEAARAGEQGRGFAVVASEVRSLAQRSATAAKEIRELIASSVVKVESGVALVHEAGGTMSSVVSSFAEVARLVTDISNASREQSSGIDQVTQAVGEMDEVTQHNAALVEEAAAAAESLEDQARSLVEVVARFKLDEATLRTLPASLERPALSAGGGARRLGRGVPPPGRGGPAFRPAQQAGGVEDEWQEF